ncbi:MAG: TetR/AcrR family transcriptional regulator, partial [Stackebrandtia sp.]
RKARRAEIVEAAVRAIHRHGPAVSMNDVAAEAEVSKPVLYRHFADQADLYHEVGRWAARWLVRWLAQHLEPGDEPREVVAAVVDAYLGAIETEPRLYRFVVRYAFADSTSPDSVDGYRAVVAEHVARVLRARLDDDHAAAAQAWAHGLAGLVQSVGDWWLDNPEAATRAQLADQLTSLIWAGVAGSLRR